MEVLLNKNLTLNRTRLAGELDEVNGPGDEVKKNQHQAGSQSIKF